MQYILTPVYISRDWKWQSWSSVRAQFEYQ